MKKRILLLMLALTVALSGCIGGKSKKNSSSNDKKIVVGIQQDLDSLDPHLAVAAGTKEVLFNVFEGLVKPDEKGNLVPAVASSYEVSEDGMTYTFKLREGVKFHNGKEVTAEDVEYSINRNAGKLDEDLLVSRFAIIDSVKAIDASTIEINLSEPDTEFIGYLTVAIIPCDYDKQATEPVGCGPYKFVSYKIDESFNVESFKDYYGEQPDIKNVTFKIVSNTDSVLLDLQAGSIDIYPYLTDDQANELSSVFNIEAGNMNLVQGLFLNNDNKYFSNKLVRQAVYAAVDRNEIQSIVSGGKGELIGSFMFHGFGKYFNEEVVSANEYSADKAKELLKEAGYPDGFEFTIKIPNNYQFHISTGEIIVEELKKVGIKANIELIDWNEWLEDVYAGRKFDATIIGFDSVLAPNDLMRRYVSDNDKNMCNYKNEEYDACYKKALATTDDEEKISLYKQMQKILSDDAASVFIQDPPLLVAVNKKISGYKFYPVYVQDIASLKMD